MSPRVVDFRLDEIEISDADWWNLPSEARRLIETYARELPCKRPGYWRFEMSIERWPEIEAVMKRLSS